MRTDIGERGGPSPDQNRDSDAAELALASLLLAFGGHAGASYLYHRDSVPSDDVSRNAKKQRDAFPAMSRLYSDRYFAPVDSRTASDALGDDKDWHDEMATDGRSVSLSQEPPLNPDHSSAYARRRTTSGHIDPLIVMNPRRGVSTMAHEFGHADMGGRYHGRKTGLLDDPVAWAQEVRFPQGGGWGLRSLAAPGPGWRKFLPLLPMAAGAVAGLPLGPELGAGIGATVGAMANLPLVAVEAEAWRRGEDYARAAGVPRRHYYRMAMAPFLTYVMQAIRNTAMGAGAGALTGLLTHPEQP
jgi:hypothetical protein